MANKKISAFTTVTDGQGSKPDVRNLSAIAGVEGAANAKISGAELVSSVINSNNSGGASIVPHRVTFYNANGESLAGSENFSWDNNTATLSVNNLSGGPVVGRLDLTHETISQSNDSGLTITTDDELVIESTGGFTSYITLQTPANGGGIRQVGKGLYDIRGISATSGPDEWLVYGQYTGGGVGDGTDIYLNNYGGYDAATGNNGARIRMTSGNETEITTGNPGNNQAGGYITIEPIGNDLNLKTRDGVGQPNNTPYPGGNINLSPQSGQVNVSSDIEFKADIKDGGGATGTSGQLLRSNGTGNGVEWVTVSSGGGIDFSSVNVLTPADITQSSQTQYGTAITVTAAANITNGEIVIWDYSNGNVRANIPSSLPGQSEIIGVAIQDIASGNTGKVLIYGYATVSGVYSVSSGFLNQTNTINFPTGSNNSPGSTVVSLPTGANEYITLFDAGGPGSGDSGNNQVSSVRLDAGAGNTVKMKIKGFDFEYSTSSGGRLLDRLQIRVGPNANSLSNATLTPGATGSGSTNNNNGWVQMNDFFGSDQVVNGPYNPSEGNVFPRDPGVGGTGPDIDDEFDLGQQVAQFDFVSDGSVQGEFELQIASSQSQTVTNTTPGAGIYLDGTNFEQATNNTSTARYIGAATGSTFADEKFVIFVAPPRV